MLNWFKGNVSAAFVVPIMDRHRKAVYFKQVAPRRPDYFMRPEEIQIWLNWLRDKTLNKTYWHLATFMVLTGTRVGEAAGLFWDAVDLKGGFAVVRRTVWWDHKTKAPMLQDGAKTAESVRIIKFPPVLTEMLKALKSVANVNEPVFHTNGQLLRYPAIQNAFKVFDQVRKLHGSPRTILWAHNGHVAKKGEVAYPFADKTMGSYLAETFGARYRVFGLLAYDLKVAPWWHQEGDPIGPVVGSLEDMLRSYGRDFLFVDMPNGLMAEGAKYLFNGVRMLDTSVQPPEEFDSSISAVPGDHFDGLIWMKTSGPMDYAL